MSWINRVFGSRTFNATDRDAVWKLFGSFRANQLEMNPSQLLDKGYEQNIDVYAVIQKIVTATKSIPWIVEKKDRDGNFEILEDTTLHELMAAPNVGKGYTWDDISEQILIYLLANGNSHMVGEKAFGSLIQEVDVLPSPSVSVSTSADFFMPNPKYNFRLGAQDKTFIQEDIEHIMLFNPLFDSVQDSFNGLSAIQVASMAVQAGNDRWEADANLLQNRGAIGLITDKSNRPMDNTESEAVQASFDRDMGGPGKFGKVKVTNKDLAYIQMAMSSTDLQLIEKGVVNLRAMCNVFGLDSSLFNDPDNKKFDNVKQADKSLYTNAVIPISDKIAAKHTKFLAENHFPGQGVRMRQDFSGVEALQTDKKIEAEKDKIEMEGITIVMALPISNEAKHDLLIEKYDFSEELAIQMTKEQPDDTVQE